MSEPWKDDPRFNDTPDLRSIRLWIIMALAFVGTIYAIRSFSGGGLVGGRGAAAGGAGAAANFSWKVSDLDGKTVDLASYKGRPIFLNVWATWCGPCMREMPSIARLAGKPELKDVAFLCISTDGSPEPVKAFVEKTKPPMTILMADDAPPPVFATEGIPATFIIGPDGTILRAEVGSTEWDTEPGVVKLLADLAREAK